MIDWFIGGATKYKKLVVNNRDLSQLVGTVTWSGDSKQVARKLVFTVASRASDRFLPKVPIREGDQVVFSYKDKSAPEKVLFGGPILDIDKAASGNSITYTALDLLFYINGSDISHVFDDTPEAITAWVCSHLGVPFGSAAPTGMAAYAPLWTKATAPGAPAALQTITGPLPLSAQAMLSTPTPLTPMCGSPSLSCVRTFAGATASRSWCGLRTKTPA